MKKFTRLFAVAAVALAIVGCSKLSTKDIEGTYINLSESEFYVPSLVDSIGENGDTIQVAALVTADTYLTTGYNFDANDKGSIAVGWLDDEGETYISFGAPMTWKLNGDSINVNIDYANMQCVEAIDGYDADYIQQVIDIFADAPAQHVLSITKADGKVTAVVDGDGEVYEKDTEETI